MKKKGQETPATDQVEQQGVVTEDTEQVENPTQAPDKAPETPATDQVEQQGVVTEDTEQVENPTQAPDKAPETPATDQVEQQGVANEKVDKILKLYSQYESLYIDSNGFVFTVDTPENQRNDAVLYKNKYYKK